MGRLNESYREYKKRCKSKIVNLFHDPKFFDDIGAEKKLRQWPPGFADLKLKDGIYQE